MRTWPDDLYGDYEDALVRCQRHPGEEAELVSPRLHLSEREAALLRALVRTSDLREAGKVSFPRVGRFTRDQVVMKVARKLESRKYLSVTWIDGLPKYDVAPLGPHLLSADEAWRRQAARRKAKR